MSQSSHPISFHRVLEVSAIILTGAFAIGFVAKMVPLLEGPLQWGVTLACGLAAYVAADFVSGLVHWMADRFGTPATPVVGANFIGPFREHHVDPKGITRHDFVETNGNNCIVLLPAFALVYFFSPGEGMASLILTATMLAFGLSIFATNQFHKWAHMDRPPRLIRILQKSHIILGVEHHSVHHSGSFDTYYCITSGWLNPLLAYLKFFERMEWLIFKLFGIKTQPDA